jgi:tetratricopeptide (TPR) repeat protein
MNLILFIIYFSFIISQNNQLNENLLQTIRNNADAIKKYTDPKVEAKYLQAKALEKAGLIEEAVVLYKEINHANPKNSKYFNAIKKYLKQNENWDTLFVFTKSYAKARQNDFISQFEYLDIYLLTNNETKWKKLSNSLVLKAQTTPQDIKRVFKLLINLGQYEYCYNLLQEYRRKVRKPDFYSIELASYLGMRMSYEESLNEYLIFLKYNPDQLQTISNRIMGFPSDDEINILIKSNLDKTSFKSAKYILADLHFKLKEFDDGYNTLIENDASPLMLLRFAKDLISIKEYIKSNKILTHIMNLTTDEKILTETIFEIAKVFELKMKKTNSKLPLTNFFSNNSFFSSPYIAIRNEPYNSLEDAMGIYDSLRVTKQNAQAAFRLAEVQFRILGDLDAALYLYEETIEHANSKNLKTDASLAIIDIYIAKGDLQAADLFCQNIIINYPNILEYQIKAAQILFYQAKFDKTDSELRKVLSQLPTNHIAVNDILDVMAVLIGFRHNQEDFINFVNAQLNIQQNKRTEALEKLESLFYSKEIYIADLCRFQYSWLNFLQGEKEFAKLQLDLIVNDTIFKELAHIFQAEIIDYIDNNALKAIDSYLNFLDLYPNSIYYDDVRLRLRELAS